MRRFPIRAFALPCLVLAFQPHKAVAQSYGLGDQILTIGAAEFLPFYSSNTYALGTDGYLYGQGQAYVAPLRLPDGAEITMMCFYAYDPSGNGSSAYLRAVKLPAGGQPAGVITIPGSIVSENFNIG